MTAAMSGVTIPNFVMAPLLSLIFGVYLGWLPVGGWAGGDAAHSVLPVIALCLPQIAFVARLMRGSPRRGDAQQLQSARRAPRGYPSASP